MTSLYCPEVDGLVCGRDHHGGYRRRVNVRSIALGLEALRAVDRYRITRRGEQYRGFKALTAGGGTARMPATVDEAKALIFDEYGSVRAALRATHPDNDGDPDEFRRVMAAREILEGAGLA